MPMELSHTVRLRARSYEMDSLGHVNNAVYLNWVEEATVEHARVLGFARDDASGLGGFWVVRRHEILYRRPATAGDELAVTTRIVGLDRARVTRRTTIARVDDEAVLAEATTEWVWVGADGRPRRLPPDAVARLRPLLADDGGASPSVDTASLL